MELPLGFGPVPHAPPTLGVLATPDAATDELRDLLHHRGFVLFKGMHLTPDKLVAAGRLGRTLETLSVFETFLILEGREDGFAAAWILNLAPLAPDPNAAAVIELPVIAGHMSLFLNELPTKLPTRPAADNTTATPTGSFSHWLRKAVVMPTS